jgi:hypothetical protein
MSLRVQNSVSARIQEANGYLAEDAVRCEPVSYTNSLLTGKNTGI